MRHIATAIEEETVRAARCRRDQISLGKWFSIDRPSVAIEPPLENQAVDRFRFWSLRLPTEDGAIPREGRRRSPFRGTSRASIFDDNSGARRALAIIDLSKNPDSRRIHLHNGVHSLAWSKIEHRYSTHGSNRIPVQCNHLKCVAGKRQAMLPVGARVQDAEEYALATLHANRLAGSQHLPLHGKHVVLDIHGVFRREEG